MSSRSRSTLISSAHSPPIGAQDRYIRGIPAHVGRHIGGYDNHGHAAKKRGDLSSLTPGEAEFLQQLSSQFDKPGAPHDSRHSSRRYPSLFDDVDSALARIESRGHIRAIWARDGLRGQ